MFGELELEDARLEHAPLESETVFLGVAVEEL